MKERKRIYQVLKQKKILKIESKERINENERKKMKKIILKMKKQENKRKRNENKRKKIKEEKIISE